MTHSLNVLRDDLGVRFGISGHVSSTYDGNAEGEPQLTERHRYERRDQQGEHHDLDDLLIVTSESSAAKKSNSSAAGLKELRWRRTPGSRWAAERI